MDCLVVNFMRLLRPNRVGPWWGKLPEWGASLGGRARDRLSLVGALQNLESYYMRLLYYFLLMLSLI